MECKKCQTSAELTGRAWKTLSNGVVFVPCPRCARAMGRRVETRAAIRDRTFALDCAAVTADPTNIRNVLPEASYYEPLAMLAVTHPRATWFTVNYVPRLTAPTAIAALAGDVRAVEAMRWPIGRRARADPYRVQIPEAVVEWLGYREFLRAPHDGLARGTAVARFKLRTRSSQSARDAAEI